MYLCKSGDLSLEEQILTQIAHRDLGFKLSSIENRFPFSSHYTNIHTIANVTLNLYSSSTNDCINIK